MSRLSAYAFLLLQYLLPRYLTTRLVYRVTRSRRPWLRDFLIRRFLALYPVDVDEALEPVPGGYPAFNDFFVRELRPGARPIDPEPGAIVAPADGTVSQLGVAKRSRLLQAKGRDYALDDLLAVDLDEARAFEDGAFATIYLAPHNYHRVHAPIGGELESARYVPGDLFSVNRATVSLLPRLFARNERVLLRFRTAAGPMALILVGALNVGSITTPWTGEIRPRRDGLVEELALAGDVPRRVEKGGLVGWFNLGSTVIVLLPTGVAEWEPAIGAETPVRVGQALGRLRPPAA